MAQNQPMRFGLNTAPHDVGHASESTGPACGKVAEWFDAPMLERLAPVGASVPSTL
jgi:hypothetical protein